jgi:DNA topoisomerase I
MDAIAHPRRGGQVHDVDLDHRTFAEEIGLRYTESETEPSIRRRGHGRGFTYIGPSGRPLPKEHPRRREIQSLAIPPAWRKVWVCPWADGHLQATGYDDAGRKQYRYHDRWQAERKLLRDQGLVRFAYCLPGLRKTVDELLESTQPTYDVVHAAAVRMLDRTGIRVGNAASVELFDTRGITTLTNAEAELGRRVVTLSFQGKGAVEQHVTVRDPQLAAVLRNAEDLDPHLFSWTEEGQLGHVTGASLTAFLREHSEPFVHPHMFRSWIATVGMVAALSELEPESSKRKAKAAIVAAATPVAEALGHSVSMCRSSYVHTCVEEMWLQGALQGLRPVALKGLEKDEQLALAALEAAAEETGRARRSA